MASHMHTDCEVTTPRTRTRSAKRAIRPGAISIPPPICKHDPVALGKKLCTDYTTREAIQPSCSARTQNLYTTQHPEFTTPGAIQPSSCGSTHERQSSPPVVRAHNIYIHTQHPEFTTPGAIQPSSCGSTHERQSSPPVVRAHNIYIHAQHPEFTTPGAIQLWQHKGTDTGPSSPAAHKKASKQPNQKNDCHSFSRQASGESFVLQKLMSFTHEELSMSLPAAFLVSKCFAPR